MTVSFSSTTNSVIPIASSESTLSTKVVSLDDTGDSAEAMLLRGLTSRNDIHQISIPSLTTPMKMSIKPILFGIDETRNAPKLPRLTPPLPPREPISHRRPRSKSEGDIGVNGRRAIFGQYWNKDQRLTSHRSISDSPMHNSNNRASIKRPSPVKKRSSSESTVINTHLDKELRDYRMFAPPKDLVDSSTICGRFASVEDIGSITLPSSLPPLPTPLQRLCSEGDSPGCLQGMYPLTIPTSILRRNSYVFSAANDCDEKTKDTTSRSIHPDTPFSEGSFDTDSSESCCGKNSVRFDPRVTVSEFEDPIERCWYDDAELEFLKHETILLAQEYLLAHPKQAEMYSRAKLDPVTGTMRKKALYSLPVLSMLGDESIPDQDGHEYEDLLKRQVKSILIVDPNKAILDLFAKSMHSMFPKASISKTQSGDEALKLVSTALGKSRGNTPVYHRNYDIIVVEQRLYNCEETERKTLSFRGVSPRDSVKQTFSALSKPSSSFSERLLKFDGSIPSKTVLGSDLLANIQALERKEFEDSQKNKQLSSKRSESSRICTNSFHWRALLIGVSVKPDCDAEVLRKAGADIVWGKPIPRVGDALRNQLLKSLVAKRKQLSTKQGESSAKPVPESKDEE